MYSAFLRFGSLQVPTVAAVRGAAVGAGLNLALAADVRIVARDARLLGFAAAAVHPGGGFFTLLSRAAGREATAAVGLFGEELSGEQAERMGLAWEAPADGHVETRALELAARAAQNVTLARATTRTLRLELGPPPMAWPDAVEVERHAQQASWAARAETTTEDAGS
jgi:enoyl-CoA hydratase